MVVGEHLPETSLDVVLADGPAHRAIDKRAFQILGCDCPKVLQRGKLGLVAASNDDYQRLQITIIAPAFRLLDLSGENVVVDANLVRSIRTVGQQVRDA